jgi:5'-phosphate synthase pdxT subunit
MEGVGGLIIPGGESTTLLKLARDFDLLTAIGDLHDAGAPILGTCAGAILLARRVTGPEQPSLGLIDIEIERNAYGRQKESFETTVPVAGNAAWGRDAEPMHLVFIRAPRIRGCGPGVDVLLRLGEEPILVREGGVTAATFHPEMSRDRRVHQLFCQDVAAAGNGPRAAANPGAPGLIGAPRAR